MPCAQRLSFWLSSDRPETNSTPCRPPAYHGFVQVGAPLHVVITIGGSRCGKSTICNALLYGRDAGHRCESLGVARSLGDSACAPTPFRSTQTRNTAPLLIEKSVRAEARRSFLAELALPPASCHGAGINAAPTLRARRQGLCDRQLL